MNKPQQAQVADTDTITAIALYQYAIDLMPLLPVAGQRINTRHGLLLSINTATSQAYTEIAPLSGTDINGAPLTGFSHESLTQTIDYLRHHLPALIGQSLDALTLLADTCPLPAAALGLSLNQAKLTGLLATRPSLIAPPFRPVPLIYSPAGQPVSAKDIHHQLAQYASNDPALCCQAVKIKVGKLPPEDEIALIYRVLSVNPTLKIRLDANRAWTLTQAIDFCAALPLDAIDYIEEPCQNPQDNPALYQSLGIHYALDESLNDPNYHFSVTPGLTALVIKPMLCGSLNRLANLVQQAHEQGVRCILSSALETSLGISDIRMLAALLTPEEAPGLDTLNAFSHSLLQPFGHKPCLSPDDLELLLQCH